MWDSFYCFEEPHFTESHDGGRTWSKPVPIVRPVMNDTCLRSGESLIYENRTGRVYHFYAMCCGDTMKYEYWYSGIGYVFKEPNSTDYSNETMVFTTHNRTMPKALSLLTTESPPRFQVFWTESVNISEGEGEAAIFTMSAPATDLTRWTSPRPIYRRRGEPLVLLSLAHEQRLSPVIFMGFGKVHDSCDLSSELLWTRNFGRDVKVLDAVGPVERYNSGRVRVQGTVVCGARAETLRGYMLTQTTFVDFEYHVVNLTNVTAQRERLPLTKVEGINGLEVSCYVRPDGKTVVSVFQAGRDYDDSDLNFTYRIYDDGVTSVAD